MKIHRFIGEYDFSKKEVEVIDPKIIKQIKDVLRLKKGEIVILSDGKGQSAETTIDLISPDKILCTINKVQKHNETERNVNLYLAILKKENFELAVQKTVEIGVHRIIPIITERTIKTGLNFPRLEKIMIEASEQSGRSVLPILSPIVNFKEALADGSNSQEKIIFSPTGIIYTPSANKTTKNISIFIGPEGGFTEKEIKEATEKGYAVTSLGSLTLRGETAAMIATYRTTKGI